MDIEFTGRGKMLEIYQDGVEVLVLPDSAKCMADESNRNPLDLDECPMGYDECLGDCEYYEEE